MSAAEAIPDEYPNRVPPCSLDAEGLVLSHAFEHGTSSMPALRPEHFYADSNRHIYAAIQACEERGEKTEPVSVMRELMHRGRLKQVGGSSYLAMLCACIPYVIPSQVNAQAIIITEFWKRRALVAAFQEAEAMLYAGSTTSIQAWEHVKELIRAQREL